MKLESLDLPDKRELPLSAIREELPEGVEIEELCEGMKTWVNPINGFRIMRIHYRVDPSRRTPEWKAEERRKYGEAEWNREQELMWEAFEGQAVYKDHWEVDYHASKTSLGWNPKLVVCRGWDFGLYGACIFAQLFPHFRLFVLRELTSEDLAFDRFVDEVARYSHDWFPGATFVEFIDPTGRNRIGADGRTYRSMLSGAPLRARRIVAGANDITARHNGVKEFLKTNVRGLPCMVVDPSCEMLIKGFNGAYLFPFDNKGRVKDKPEKNEFSHPHDGLQYLCSKVKNINLEAEIRGRKVTEPRYGGRAPSRVDQLTRMQ